MKKKDYKRRCEKISLSKCDGGICRAFIVIVFYSVNRTPNFRQRIVF